MIARPRKRGSWLDAGFVLSLLVGSWGTLRAEVQPYTIEILDGEAVSYKLALALEHPGTLGIQAEWSAPRILSLRLEGPADHHQPVRRSGPSPQRIEVQVRTEDLVPDRPWTLYIRALPARGSGSGLVTIDLPEAAKPARDRDEVVPPSPAPEPEPWALASRPPRHAPAREVRLFQKVESFRQQVVEENGALRPDSCRWQSGLLRYAVGWRDRLSETGAVPSVSSRRYLRRLAKAIQSVEELRTSKDPILVGPAPEDRSRQRAWLALREQKLRPLELDLDLLSHELRRGLASELNEQEWPVRLIVCLTACERHFEQRVLVGAERATNYELAHTQWEPMLAAAEVLEALLDASDEPPDEESGELFSVSDP